MAGLNLEGADLRATDLRGTNFTGSNLRYADFRGSNVQGAAIPALRFFLGKDACFDLAFRKSLAQNTSLDLPS